MFSLDVYISEKQKQIRVSLFIRKTSHRKLKFDLSRQIWVERNLQSLPILPS